MEYINEININQGIIHILDNNADEPLLNEYPLDLTEEVYEFVFKHIQRCLKDEELKYAIFNKERNIVKEVSQEYLNGENDLINVSKELASQMFILMRSKGSIPSCDLLTVSFTTEHGAFLGIFKMDYIKNYMHNVEFVEGKVGIHIVPQFTGLPSSSSRIQKCAFIKVMASDNDYDLLVIDKQNKANKDSTDYGANYFIDNYLGCTIIENSRDKTKQFLKVAEKWTQTALNENAEGQEIVRREVKRRLREEETIDLATFTEEVFQNDDKMKESFKTFAVESGVGEKIDLDKQWVEKKLKRVRLKIDKDIDIYISEEAYNDINRFEIERVGDGSINMKIKHILNYSEK
ncbi:MAG: nucleoid-associated protein [Clostridium sp.]|uniref:nucleoid-associated protein n=1 Tax=Clostridium sp. TaxID=1506 RepID=UPI00306EC4BC